MASKKKKPLRTQCERCRQGRRNRAQTRDKLGQQKRARALLRKKAFSAANAGIRLKRDLAKKLEDLDAFAAAKLIQMESAVTAASMA